MGIVAIDAADDLQSCVGYGRGFTDVVMTRKTEVGFAVGYQCVEGTFMKGVAALGENGVHVFSKEVFMAFAVGRMAADTVEVFHLGAKMGCLQIFVIGIVAHDT